MSILSAPRNSVKSSRARQPLDVRLTLTIRGTSYAVTPIPPGSDNSKAYRLEKLGGKGEVYDLARTNDGLIICDCPSYVATHEGTLSCCKHGNALIQVGLMGPPGVGISTHAPYAAHVAQLAAIAESEDVVRREGEMTIDSIDSHSAPAKGYNPIVPPAPELVPPLHRFDREYYRCQNAVAERRASWLAHKPEPVATAPEPAELPDDAEVRELIEAGAYEEAEGEAPLGYATPECFDAVAAGRADWAREYGYVPVPGWTTKAERDEMLADQAVEDGWASRPTWYREYLEASLKLNNVQVDEPDPEPEMPMAELVELEAARYRGWGTDLGDLLGERMDALAAQMRLLEATTPDQFRDRRDAMIDSAVCRAEARLAAAGC